jgi:hypothetical protein
MCKNFQSLKNYIGSGLSWCEIWTMVEPGIGHIYRFFSYVKSEIVEGLEKIQLPNLNYSPLNLLYYARLNVLWIVTVDR